MDTASVESPETGNAGVIEAWDTVLFDKFLRFRHLLTDGLCKHGDTLLERHPPQPGMHVLDIGCGFGDMTQQIADLVGKNGKAVGVDCARRFVTASEQDASENRSRAAFFVGDVQADDLGGPYDAMYARFGTMFFMTPVRAYRNMLRSLKPGAQLSMVAWRVREDNPWIHLAEVVVRELVEENHDSDEPTCGPGPFSMAGPNTVSEQLLAAGYERITFERVDHHVCIGRDLDEALEFALALGPAGEILRLAAAPVDESRVRGAIREVLEPYVTDTGVWAPSSTWIVTARRPVTDAPTPN